jgi:hypothetical protein
MPIFQDWMTAIKMQIVMKSSPCTTEISNLLHIGGGEMSMSEMVLMCRDDPISRQAARCQVTLRNTQLQWELQQTSTQGRLLTSPGTVRERRQETSSQDVSKAMTTNSEKTSKRWIRLLKEATGFMTMRGESSKSTVLVKACQSISPCTTWRRTSTVWSIHPRLQTRRSEHCLNEASRNSLASEPSTS